MAPADLQSNRPCVDPKSNRAPTVASMPTTELRTLTMVHFYRANGGIASGDELLAHFPASASQPMSTIARWIVCRQVVSFRWRQQICLPLFQFDLPVARITAAASVVIGELKPALDDWELAMWFSQPNAWLNGSPPTTLLALDPQAVLDAARGDRFASTG